MQNKTVFDTNIWVSYFIKGKFNELIDFIESKNVTFYRCVELLIELQSVLMRKKFRKYLTLPIEDYINFFVSLTQSIIINKKFDDCRDAKDNYLFDLAAQSKAKFLVSGDRDILSVSIPLPFMVMNLTDFKKAL